MRIPYEILNRYPLDKKDVDSALFLSLFDEACPGKVLVVGAHDEASASRLGDMGYDVTGVDLRPLDNRVQGTRSYKHTQLDFCEPSFLDGARGSFDIFVSLSTIEHFGMGCYGEPNQNPFYDVIAMRKAWELLRVGGKAYVTVPMGSHYLEVWPEWRIYNMDSAKHRIVQRFAVQMMVSATANELSIDGRVIKAGDRLSPMDLQSFCGIPPCVSTLFVMEKT